jgi:acetyltransferase-like isoleucine patch superfamily enzyme
LRKSAPGLRLGRCVDLRGAGRLVLGSDVTVESFVTIHCGGTGWGPPDTQVKIGNRCYVGPGCTLFGAGGIVLEDDVLLSPGVVLTTHQHSFGRPDLLIREQALRFGPIRVEVGAWLGANAVVLPGVVVGRGAVVGAGAVVTRDVAPGAVVIGVPARSREP